EGSGHTDLNGATFPGGHTVTTNTNTVSIFGAADVINATGVPGTGGVLWSTDFLSASGTQTGTNKTFTSPVLNSPTMTTPTLGVAGATSINFGGSTLSTYASGTWTPTLRFGGGTTGITYAAQQGTYTQIGSQVIASFHINLSNKGSSTGSAQ